jgi:inner membrane protein
VDNVTHSLLGIALADLVIRGGAPKAERRIAAGAAVIAANLPDIDIVYTPITPAPLGYLLHHRGHTHTILGIVALAVVLIAMYRRLPPVRKLRSVDRVRLWALIAIALASHLLLDALNSYGIHPFYPIDSAWYYGDAVFIFEPWLWTLLGIAVAWNARGTIPRVAAVFPVLIFPLVMASTGLLPADATMPLAVAGAGFAMSVKRSSARRRAAVALAACLVVVGGFALGSRAARRAAVAALASEVNGRVVDVVLTSNPSSPVCWSAIVVELDESHGEYVLWRGTASLVPRWKRPTECASHRFGGPREARTIENGGFALIDEIHQPLPHLRALARTDCWVRAWLQFGRAPVVARGEIFDLRFPQPAGRRFTYMAVAEEGRACPSNLPGWGMPRADLISR